jgi:hypothetical protein
MNAVATVGISPLSFGGFIEPMKKNVTGSFFDCKFEAIQIFW